MDAVAVVAGSVHKGPLPVRLPLNVAEALPETWRPPLTPMVISWHVPALVVKYTPPPLSTMLPLPI